MSREEQEMRFEELDAGRALGDLDATETTEWEALAKLLGKGGDPAFDAIVGEMEARSPTASLPPQLARHLVNKTRPASVKPRITYGPWIGWGLAACLLGLLLIRGGNKPDALPTPAVRREALLGDAGPLIRLPFSGAGSYAAAGGEVVWSDGRQEGYLTLTHLPANDPGVSQYQLWIVDPARDEFPVDGGVFDVPASGGPLVIPIDAKLRVKSPAAFVITLEKPGGVVRSKQEIVVAVAKS